MTCNIARPLLGLLGILLISAPAFSQAAKPPEAQASAPASPAAAAPADVSGKAPVPDAAQMEQLRKEVADAYKGNAGFGDTTAAGKKRLARKLLEESAEPIFSADDRYAMLDTALQFATSTWDVATVFDTVDAINKAYQGDAGARTLSAYTTLAMSAADHATSSDCAAIASRGLDMMDACVAQDDLHGALGLLEAVKKVTATCNDDGLRSRLEPLNFTLSDYSHAMTALDILKSDPANAQSNTDAGIYYFVKGDIEKARPYLALGIEKGTNGELRELAIKDRDCPADPAQQEQLAIAWSTFGAKNTGRLRRPSLLRSLAWDEIVMPQLTEFALKRVKNHYDGVNDLLAADASPGVPAAPTIASPTISGDKRIRAAIDGGLAWLCLHQASDGAWHARKLGDQCDPGTPCTTDDFVETYDEGITGLAVLAILGASSTPGAAFEIPGTKAGTKSLSSDVVSHALGWLMSRQQPDGSVKHTGTMYNECITTMALAEAARQYNNDAWRKAAKRSLDYVVQAQKRSPMDAKQAWGWRYTPRGDSIADTSVTGWALRAFDAAKRAGLDVPKDSWQGASDFLAWVTAKDGLVGYLDPAGAGEKVTGHNDTFNYHIGTLSALGIQACLEAGDALQTKPPEDFVKAAAAVVLKDSPSVSDDGLSIDYYFWHQGTLAWSALGSHGFKSLELSGKAWRAAATEMLLKLQDVQAGKCSRGGWLRKDRWCYAGGPTYSTALSVVTLEALGGSSVLARTSVAPPKPTPVAVAPVAVPPAPRHKLDWAEVREREPDPKVIADADLLKRIHDTGLPWRVIEKSSGIEMLCIPHGKFRMGAPLDDVDALDGERPAREVTISHDFYLARFETQDSEWAHVLTGAASVAKHGLPKSEVSFVEIQDFLAKSDGLRLPTEAEWEYAARAGSAQPRSDDVTKTSWFQTTAEDKIHSVGDMAANGLGLHDMLGNVCEWCADWYDPQVYRSRVDGCADPALLDNSKRKLTQRVLRGGSYLTAAKWLRFSTRQSMPAENETSETGFRVAHDP